jgi:hypothetical protein
LADVAKELGRPMDADELEECMKDLDTTRSHMMSSQSGGYQEDKGFHPS